MINGRRAVKQNARPLEFGPVLRACEEQLRGGPNDYGAGPEEAACEGELEEDASEGVPGEGVRGA